MHGDRAAPSTRLALSPRSSSGRRSNRSSAIGPRSRSCSCGSSIRRWAAARSSSPPAAISHPRSKSVSSLEGRWHEGDIDASDRAALRREIAQRCLFGVDLNPMAVQLARLSIWLATLASDKPLTFLDHHLVAGNSLIGASLEDVWRQPSARHEQLPAGRSHCRCSTDMAVTPVLREAVRTRLKLAREPDDSAALVHAKEKIARRPSRSAFAAWPVVGGARPVVRRLVLGGRTLARPGPVPGTRGST